VQHAYSLWCGLQASESIMRTLDHREASNTLADEQFRAEADARITEAMLTVNHLKKHTDSDVRGLHEGVRTEMRQRDGHVKELDSLARALVTRIHDLEGERSAAKDRMSSDTDGKVKMVSEHMALGQQQTLERLLVLERVLQREAELRQQADAEVRQELGELLVVFKSQAGGEEAGRKEAHREIRTEVNPHKSTH
jgi:hypothetical protein